MRRRIGKGGNVVPLKLVLSEVHKLEYWEVWHAIDEESPLFGNLDLLKMIYVQVTAFDTSYKQEVRLSHEYPTSTLRMGLEFAPMIAGGFGSEVPTTFVDHSKLDRLVLSIPDDDDDDNVTLELPGWECALLRIRGATSSRARMRGRMRPRKRVRLPRPWQTVTRGWTPGSSRQCALRVQKRTSHQAGCDNS